MAPRIAMRPVPALTTVAPLEPGGLVLPVSDGDGDTLVVTAGEAAVRVLINDQLLECSNAKTRVEYTHVLNVLRALELLEEGPIVNSED